MAAKGSFILASASPRRRRILAEAGFSFTVYPVDCAEYNEYKGLFRLEGSLSAVNGFANKVGAGLGAGMLGILLGLSGYDETLAVQGLAQGAAAINMIRLLYSLIPAALYLVVYLTLHLYTLDKIMPEVRRTNEENRAKAAAEKAEA